MEQQDQPVIDEATTTADNAADAATLNSDAAVGGSVGGGSGERRRQQQGESPLVVAVAAAAAGAGVTARGGSGDNNNSICRSGQHSRLGHGGHRVNAHARQRHYRKRALSAAGTSSGANEAGLAAVAPGVVLRAESGHLSGGSLLNSSTMGSNIMSSGAEHSIVSFGLNFNFDNTSSPSNSDNDGKMMGGQDASGGSSEDDAKGIPDSTVKPPALKANGAIKGVAKASSLGSGGKKKQAAFAPDTRAKGNGGSKEGSGNGSNGEEGDGKNSSSKGSSGSKAKKHASVRFGPNGGAPAGEEGSGSSTSSGSDSYMNNDSGGSASGGSNSGNDGSSGGKSTVSSLTTSSNQEWMATNESAEAAVAAAATNNPSGGGTEAVGGGSEAVDENGVADGKAASAQKDSKPSIKKRKKVTIIATATGGDIQQTKVACATGGGSSGAGGEDDDGYKTDEEQWGGGKTGHQTPCPSHAVATHKGVLQSGRVGVGLGEAGAGAGAGGSGGSMSKNSQDCGVGPPLKQARFSIDHQHPQAVQSADASAQPLSSLSGSDSAGVPVVTASSGGQTQGLSGLSAAAATFSNPSGSSGLMSLGGLPPPGAAGSAAKRGKGQHIATMDPNKRKERNAREKERSCRIARQIDDLRTMLSRGGVIVNKGTKSSVLAEAANYINLLQQQQVQWEMDRQALMQQMQQIGVPLQANNILQTQPQTDVHIANGGMQARQQAQQVGSLQTQGGLPGQPQGVGGVPINPQGQTPAATNVNAISPNDYKFIFDNCSVGMAIASLGGAFVDCNPIFCQLSEYTMEEVCAMTIFNMTSRQDLQQAFDLISQMITPTLESGGMADKVDEKSSIVLRGAMKKHDNLGLSISLIKGPHGIAKCFCVTLVRILSMETKRPDTVSIEVELPQVWSTKQQKNVGFGSSPAYTSG